MKRRNSIVEQQESYLEHKTLVEALGLPVLMRNPMEDRESLELAARRRNRRTKAEMTIARAHPVFKKRRMKIPEGTKVTTGIKLPWE